jgi:predicted small secreted protein
MKKVLLTMALFAALSFTVSAEDTASGSGKADSTKTAEAAKSTAKTETSTKAKKTHKWPSWMTTQGATVETGMRRVRNFELGILSGPELSSLSNPGMNIGLSNSWFKFSQIFGMVGGDTPKFEDLLDKGALNLEVGAGIPAVSLGIKFGKLFTLNINADVDANVRMGLSDDAMSSLKSAKNVMNKINDLSSGTNFQGLLDQINSLGGDINVEGEAYAVLNVAANRNWLSNKLYTRAELSPFVPLAYFPRSSVGLHADPNNPQHWNDYYTGGKHIKLEGNGGINGYYIGNGKFPFGMDLSLEGRYAIWPILDAGMTVEDIPIIPAAVNYNASINGSDISFDWAFGGDPTMNVPGGVGSNGSGHYLVMRPLRMSWYALYKPFKSKLLIVRPELGFSRKFLGNSGAYNTFNWGVGAQLNLKYILSLGLTMKEFEKVFSNQVSMILDFRAFELDLGVALRGPDFKSSWTGKGLAAAFGMKFGW